jgi:hypothetical protein
MFSRLRHWFSVRGQNSSISMARELVPTANNIEFHHRATRSETLKVGSTLHVVTSPPATFDTHQSLSQLDCKEST